MIDIKYNSFVVQFRSYHSCYWDFVKDISNKYKFEYEWNFDLFVDNDNNISKHSFALVIRKFYLEEMFYNV